MHTGVFRLRLTLTISRLTFAFLLVFAAAVAFTSGPPAGFTGGSTEPNCTACHSGAALNAGPAQFSLSASDSFNAAGTATVTAAFGITPSIKHGFQVMGKDSAGAYVGGWSLLTPSTTQKNGPNHVNHTAAGTALTSWSADSIPGALPAGPVTFYAAGNQTNANNAPNGDNIYTRSVRVYQAGLSANATWALGSVQPLTLAAPTQTNQMYVIAVSELSSPETPVNATMAVPLNLAGQFVQLGWSLPTIFQNFVGVLDAQGNANAAVAIPYIPTLSGLTLHFAYATVSGALQVTEVSNRLTRTLQ